MIRSNPRVPNGIYATKPVYGNDMHFGIQAYSKSAAQANGGVERCSNARISTRYVSHPALWAPYPPCQSIGQGLANPKNFVSLYPASDRWKASHEAEKRYGLDYFGFGRG